MELEQKEVGVGKEVEAATSTSNPTTDGSSDRQPEQPNEKQQKVNLDELEEFRQWKSKMDQNLTAAQQRAAQAAAEAERLKKERDAAKMEKMSDEERLRYELEQTRAELTNYRQRSEQQLLMAQKEQQLAQIVAETGVPREAIEEAQTPSEAWAIALSYYKTKAGKAQAETERQEAVSSNRTDIGGGDPLPTKNVRAKVDEAIAKGDMEGIWAAHNS